MNNEEMFKPEVILLAVNKDVKFILSDEDQKTIEDCALFSVILQENFECDIRVMAMIQYAIEKKKPIFFMVLNGWEIPADLLPTESLYWIRYWETPEELNKVVDESERVYQGLVDGRIK